MACLNPIRAYRQKRGSYILWKRPSDGLMPHFAPFPIPCGKCYGCRLEYSRQWAVRMMLESQLHDFNYFLTISYAPAHLPAMGTIVKKDLQDFHKRLRIYYERHYEHTGIRYYCCGEYGEKKGRPHYHGIYFNLPIFDLELYKESNGNKYYRSKTIEEIWGKGMIIIANVTFESCGYVARYVTKKIDSQKKHKQTTQVVSVKPTKDAKVIKRIRWIDGNGLQQERCIYDKTETIRTIIHDDYWKAPEFSIMSKNPAIGLDWLFKYWKDVYRDDFIILNGRKIKPPKYFDTIIRNASKDVNPDFWQNVKKKRVDNRIDYEDDYYDVRLPSIRKIANQRFKKLIRVLEQEN